MGPLSGNQAFTIGNSGDIFFILAVRSRLTGDKWLSVVSVSISKCSLASKLTQYLRLFSAILLLLTP